MSYALRRPGLLAAAGLLGLAGLRAGAAVPDPLVMQGEAIAQRQCSACHVVAAHQEYPPLLEKPAPSFFEIARRPGISEKGLSRTISGKHWNLDQLPMTMPNQELSPKEVHAVARYLLSLGRTH